MERNSYMEGSTAQKTEFKIKLIKGVEERTTIHCKSVTKLSV